MAKTAAEIKVILDDYLKTEPDPNSEELDILITTLTHYRVRDWEEYKQQIPDLFGYNFPSRKQLKERFRRMYNQLRKQGIAVKHDPELSNQAFEQWLLGKEDKLGLLLWHKESDKWDIQGFCFQDENGNLLKEFADVSVL